MSRVRVRALCVRDVRSGITIQSRGGRARFLGALAVTRGNTLVIQEMKWIALAALLACLSGCATWPASASLLTTATAGASALTGHGMTVEINVMSKNTTNTCTCTTCK